MTFFTLLNPKNVLVKTGGAISGLKTGGVENIPILIQKIGGAISLPQLALTITGNPVTDADRWKNIQGDGLPIGSGYGAWEGSSNYNKNSGAETSTTAGGWLGYGSGSTPSRDLANFKFGTASFKVVFNGDVSGTMGYTNQGNFNFGSTLPAVAVGDKWTISGYFKATPGFNAKLIRILCRMRGGANAQSDVTTVVTLTSSGFIRWSATNTVDFADRTGIDIFFIQSSAPIIGEGFYVDGIQLEPKPIPTPVIHTDGSAIARGTALADAPISLVSLTQGAFAARIQMGFSSSIPPTTTASLRIAAITDGNGGATSGRILLLYRPNAGNVWSMFAADSSGNADQAIITSAFNNGDFVTVIGKWDSGKLYLSINGSAFVSVNRTRTVTGFNFLTFGNEHGSGNSLDGNILWLITMGNNVTLTDADAASINAYGNTAPSIRILPNAWNVTGLWRGNNALIETLPPGRGDKSLTTGKIGGGNSPGHPGTAKAITVEKFAGGITRSVSGATTTRRFIRIGGARTELWAGVTSHRLLNVKTGGLRNPVVAGGTFRALKLKSGGGVTVSRAGGSYRGVAVHTGGGKASALAGAGRVTGWRKAGGSASISKAGSVYRVLKIKTAGGKSSLTTGTTRKTIFNRIGGLKSQGKSGGTKTSFFEYSKIGGSLSSLTIGTAKSLLITKFGGGIVVGRGGGHPIFIPDTEYQWLLSIDLGEATLINASEKNPVLLGADEDVAELMVGKMETPVLKKVRVR